MNLCECGGEVTIEYDKKARFGTHYCAVCNDCGGIYPLVADNKIEAEKEWNEKVSETGGWTTP